MALETTQLAGPAGPLELLYSLPHKPDPSRPPVLLIHGSFCSAHDYMYFLPYLAQHGFAAYAVSLRGHGSSQGPGAFKRMFLTTIDDWAADVNVAFEYISANHPDHPPAVLGGHSLGGGLVQYMVSSGKCRPSGLVLLAAAPLSGGGKEIMANWERVEAPGGYDYPWSPRCVLDTVERVRAAFFGPRTEAATIQTWIDKCLTKDESARAGLSVLWRFGDANKVLDQLKGIETGGASRKLLCVVAGADKLTPQNMCEANLAEYESAAGGRGESCMKLMVEGSGHHLMMDVGWETCAQGVVTWLHGE